MRHLCEPLNLRKSKNIESAANTGTEEEILHSIDKNKICSTRQIPYESYLYYYTPVQ